MNRADTPVWARSPLRVRGALARARDVPLVAVIAGSALLPSTAAAKQETEAFVVCGAERCRELRGEVMRLASTLTMHAGRGPRRAAPFYDVFFIVGEPGGARSTPGGALCYVPSAWAVRSPTASGEGVWFRVDPAAGPHAHPENRRAQTASGARLEAPLELALAVDIVGGRGKDGRRRPRMTAASR